MDVTCTACKRWEAFYNKHEQNNVKGVGNPNAYIFIVGETFSTDEIDCGGPFRGEFGREIKYTLASNNINSKDIWYSNAVRCWASRDKPPTEIEIKHCRPYLLQEINLVKPRLIITIGKTGNSALGIKRNIESIVGNLQKSPYTFVPVLPLYPFEYALSNESIKVTNRKLLLEAISKAYTNDVKIENKALKMTYPVLQTEKEVQKFADFIIKQKLFSFDIETTGLDFFLKVDPPRMRCIAFAWGKGKAVCIPYDEKFLPYIKKILESKVPKIAHNFKFDVGFLRYKYGIHTKNMFMDTLLAAYLIDEYAPVNLQDVTMRYVPEMAGYDEIMEKKYKWQTWKAEGMDLWQYNCGDADVTLRAAIILYKELRRQDMWWLNKHIMIKATELFIEMEEVGVQFNRIKMQEIEYNYITAIKQLKQNIKELPIIKKFEYDFKKEFSPTSEKDLKEVFFNYYKLPPLRYSAVTDEPGLGKEELKQYADPDGKYKNELAMVINEIRGLEKALSTYLTGFYKYLYDDDIVHTIFNLHRTKTGRTSSGGGKDEAILLEELLLVNTRNKNRLAPNLQNIPKKNLELRNIVKARDGFRLISADFSQAEVGVAAALSQDEALILAYMSDQDLHTTIAAAIFQIPYEEVTKEQRNYAKTVTFGILYGIGVKGLASRINQSEEFAEELITSYFDKYKGLAAYIENIKRDVNTKHYVVSPTGRRRRFNVISAGAYRQATNMPIQSFGSGDLLLLSAIFIKMRLEKLNLTEYIYPVMCVHDEVILEVKEGYEETACDIMTKAMTKDIYKINKIKNIMGKVRLGIEIKASPIAGGWGEMEEYAIAA